MVQTPENVTYLEGIKKDLAQIKAQSNLTDPLENFKADIGTIQNMPEFQKATPETQQLIISSVALLNRKEAYISALKSQLEKEEPPFSWNKVNPGVEENFWKDIQQYIILIAECTNLEDTRLMDELGICPLWPTVSNLLAIDDLNRYIASFQEMKNSRLQGNRRTETPYWNYLIRAFQYRLSIYNNSGN